MPDPNSFSLEQLEYWLSWVNIKYTHRSLAFLVHMAGAKQKTAIVNLRLPAALSSRTAHRAS